MTSIFPLAFFGSISYYKELVAAKDIIFEQWETFPRHSIRNHCTILSPNGIIDLTIPLSKPNGSKTISKEILIDSTTDWRKKHWRTIVSSYSSSPFFDYYGIEILELIENSSQNLIEFNLEIHNRICLWLDLEINFKLSNDYIFEVEKDFRNKFKNRVEEKDNSYQQVFSARENFIPDLSILDAVLNLGPMARNLIVSS